MRYPFLAQSLGDINLDGSIEIIEVEQSYPTTVHAWNSQGNEITGFPVEVPLPFTNYEIVDSAPVILDVDGDNRPEIILVIRDWTEIKKSYIYVIDDNGQVKNDATWPFYIGQGFSHEDTSLAFDDIDNDGLLEFVVAFSKYNPVYPEWMYGGGEIRVYDLNMPYHPRQMQWPQFLHDIRHTANYSTR